jgi:hypothetical protein
VLFDQLAGEDLVVAGLGGVQDLRDVYGVVGGLSRSSERMAQPARPSLTPSLVGLAVTSNSASGR